MMDRMDFIIIIALAIVFGVASMWTLYRAAKSENLIARLILTNQAYLILIILSVLMISVRM